MAKMEPSLSLEGSNLGCPGPGRPGSADLGHTALGAGCLQSSTYCDHTGTVATGAGVVPTDKSITPLSTASSFGYNGEKWELCCRAASQWLWELQLDAGPRPNLAEGTAVTQPHSRAQLLGQDTALQATSNAEGAQCLWGLFFTPAVIK